MPSGAKPALRAIEGGSRGERIVSGIEDLHVAVERGECEAALLRRVTRLLAVLLESDHLRERLLAHLLRLMELGEES